MTKRDGGAIGLALIAMLTAAACGGGVDHEDASHVDQTPTTPTPPPAPFDRASCGEGGSRMNNALCATAVRQVPCDVAATLDAKTTGSNLDPKTCERICPVTPMECADPNTQTSHQCGRVHCGVNEVPGGREVSCFDACPGGRRPAGYGGEASSAGSSLGRAFARLAQLESVSIPAFGRLAEELTRLGLSRDLAARAREAQRDEVRHARDTWALARRFGASPTRLERMPRARTRSLLELALENVEEGCVREAYGAVVAAHQARAARDPEVRRVMQTIARDEAAHAALAWDLHEELAAMLSGEERAQVAEAMDRAWSSLARDLWLAENDEELRAEAGLPDRASAFAGLEALERAVRERVTSVDLAAA